jgi:hypothetical protein
MTCLLSAMIPQHRRLCARAHLAQVRVNHAKSRIRARIEHVFGAQQRAPGGRIVRTIGMVRARQDRLAEPGLEHSPPGDAGTARRGMKVAVSTTLLG